MSDLSIEWRPADAFAGFDAAAVPSRSDVAPGVRVALIDHVPMATLIRARDAAARFAEIVTTLWGVVPPPPGRVEASAAVTLVWSGPSQWLAIPTTYDIVALRTAFAGAAAVTEQGDGRVLFEISGRAARETLAKGLAIDLHPSVFRAGCTAVTALSHLSVQIWQKDEAPRYVISVPRTVVAHVWDWLTGAAAEFGLDVARRGGL